MSAPELRNRVIEEIRRIPEDRLAELYDFVYFFRKGLETSAAEPAEPMNFAGAWSDMAEEDFLGLLGDVAERRHRAFTRRCRLE